MTEKLLGNTLAKLFRKTQTFEEGCLITRQFFNLNKDEQERFLYYLSGIFSAQNRDEHTDNNIYKSAKRLLRNL